MQKMKHQDAKYHKADDQRTRMGWKLPLLATATVMSLSGCGQLLCGLGGGGGKNCPFDPDLSPFPKARREAYGQVVSNDGKTKWECNNKINVLEKDLLNNQRQDELLRFYLSDEYAKPTVSFEVKNIPGIERIEYTPVRLIPPTGKTVEQDIPERKAGEKGGVELNGYSVEVSFSFYDGKNRVVKKEKVILEEQEMPDSGSAGCQIPLLILVGPNSTGACGSVKFKPVKYIEIQKGLYAVVHSEMNRQFTLNWNGKFEPIYVDARFSLYIVQCDENSKQR